MKHKSNLFIFLILILFLVLNYTHSQNKDNNIFIIKDSEDEDDDESIPNEPRRFYDSRFITRKQMKTNQVPINVPTRGEPPSYQQIGILTDESDSENIKPLYGRQTYRGSNQWNYFTSLDSHLATKIPITMNSTDCTDERGCKELYKNDTIGVGGKDYDVTMYGTIAPRYIPY